MSAPSPDSRDPRVEKMATFHAGNNDPDDNDDFVAKVAIRDVEAAGLLVLDPTDDALVERIARAICGGPDNAWDRVLGAGEKESLRDSARAVLAALANPR